MPKWWFGRAMTLPPGTSQQVRGTSCGTAGSRSCMHSACYTPTPELVHGVVVASALLAAVFRKAGIFSGQEVKQAWPTSTVHEIRCRHWMQQEQRRKEAEKGKSKPSAV